MSDTDLVDGEKPSDYWMISNFPSQLLMPSDSIVDFRVSITFNHCSASGEHIEKSPAYDVQVFGVPSLEEASIKIGQRAIELLKRDYPNATVYL